MPKRPKSGSGHLRLDNCRPSNGRQKIAYDRPDFFAKLRSLPSAIDDARDTLYKPNQCRLQSVTRVCCHTMTFFLFSFPCFLFLSCLSLHFLALIFASLFRFLAS